MKRYAVAFVGVLIVTAATLYFSGVFNGESEKRLRLGQSVGVGAFGFALEYVRCHQPISAIPAKQRRQFPLEKLRGEVCFGAVRLTGPLFHIPPLIIGNLYVGKFVYPSLTNVTDVAHGTEQGGYGNVLVDMVFAIPAENVPTEVKVGALNQISGRKLFSVRYQLPLTDATP
jgi:hypothetical protein